MKTCFICSELGPLKLTFDGSFLIKISFVDANIKVEETVDEQALLFKKQLTSYLEGKSIGFTIPYKLITTPFQKRVLKAVSTIRYGDRKTYQEIGRMIDSKAYRAIGNALRNNPLPLVIPCHRAVSKSGDNSFYLGRKSNIKEKLLQLELTHRQLLFQAS